MDREERPASLVPPVLEGPRVQQERPSYVAEIAALQEQIAPTGRRTPDAFDANRDRDLVGPIGEKPSLNYFRLVEDQRRTSSMSSRVSPSILTSRQPDPGLTGRKWNTDAGCPAGSSN